MRVGTKVDRLSWPGKSVTRRSSFVSTVITISLRALPWPFTNQIAPVIEAATFTDVTLFQRSRPPWAFTAEFSNSFMLTVTRRTTLHVRGPRLFSIPCLSPCVFNSLRKRTALKVNKLDTAILFRIDSHEPKRAPAGRAVAYCRDHAVAGQNSD